MLYKQSVEHRNIAKKSCLQRALEVINEISFIRKKIWNSHKSETSYENLRSNNFGISIVQLLWR